MNLYGQDMDELIQPDQAGLTWTVSLKNADRRFIGRDALEQFATPATFIGPEAARARRHARAHGRAHRAGHRRTHQRHHVAHAGSVHRLCPPAPRGTPGRHGPRVDIRGKWVPALACKLPFVRNGKAVEHS